MKQSLTCSLSLCISAVAAFSLPASRSSSSWFSANHCSFFFRADTSSLCFSSSKLSSEFLSPDTRKKTKNISDLVNMSSFFPFWYPTWLQVSPLTLPWIWFTWSRQSLGSGEVSFFLHELQVDLQGLFLLLQSVNVFTQLCLISLRIVTKLFGQPFLVSPLVCKSERIRA